MSHAVVLALGAGAAGVGGAWELLASLQRERVSAWLEGALRPLRRAAAAGAAPSHEERRRLALVAAGCLLAAGWIVAGPVAGIVAAVAGPATAAGGVRRARRRYRAAVANGAADAARTLAASLAAGRSVRSAIADAGAALSGPVAHELARTAAALAAGDGTDGALEALRLRAGGRAWDTLVAAILLQRDAGGDLATLLRDLAGTLEQAARAERDARAATSQARFTAWTVAGLPVVAAVLAELADPGFVAGLVSRPLSAVLVAMATGLEVVALLAIRTINRGVERAGVTAAVLAALLAGPLAAAGIADLAVAAAARPRRPRRRPWAAAARLGRRVGVPRAPRDLERRLRAAAVTLGPADAMAAKVGAAAAGCLAALPLAAGAPGRLGLVLPAAGAAAGYLALDGWLLVRARRRLRTIGAELPDVVDLLRVAVQAGLPPARALAEVGRRHPGLLAAELGRTAAQASLGRPRTQALAELRDRAPLAGVAALVAALERADRLGAPPGEALAALAAEARTASARARIEAAARAAPKIQLVVALLLVPAVMLLVAAALAPAVLSLA